MDEQKLMFENTVLDRIKGKVNLLQMAEKKDAIIRQTMKEFCDSQMCRMKQCTVRPFCQDEAREDFIRQLQSYDPIEKYLADPQIEDIIINGMDKIHVHHTEKGLVETTDRISTIEELDLLIKKLMVFAGKEDLKKINDLDIPGMRGRVNIIFSPYGSELTITKTKTNPLSIIDLIENNTLTSDMAAQLWLYVEGMGIKAANILIVGGPGCGKTTLLNALLSFVPSTQHSVVIEDTFELVTNWIKNASRLESDDDLSLADLVRNSLRMRPERIIIGEVRGKEAEDMITAMNIGKYCLATLHASKTRDAILRLQSHPMNISPILVNLIDIFIVVQKEKRKSRVARVVSEITETAGLEQGTVLIAPVWQYQSAMGRFEMTSPSTVYRDKLNRASGIDNKAIMTEVQRRRFYLEKLMEKQIHSAAEVALHCQSYIDDPEKALAPFLNSNQDKEEIKAAR